MKSVNGWLTRHQICCQDFVKQACQTQKIRPDFLFWPDLLDKGMQPINYNV